jgi:DNA primase
VAVVGTCELQGAARYYSSMDAAQEIKSRLSIEDVISEYVQLKRAGRNYKGLSPFTNERTPSFTVSPEKQIWHDFSSGRGGDMFSFVMEMEGLDFKGALDLLARRAGVDLEQFKSGPAKGGKQKERLYELLELAAKFYQVQFSRNTTALRYVLRQRKFTKDTALAWRLGYAPNTGRAVTDYAKKHGYTAQEMERAGLVNRYGGDLFRGRLMIPLQDPTGRVIGFTARMLENEPNAPKYINTPQTPLYDKSRHVFGLHLAKEAIRKSTFVVLAEGNLDVIASHQAGLKQCVATAGTALTEQQLKALGRFTPDIRLAFDADRAGLAATERAIPIASRVGINLSVVTIPSGKDPDELIKQSVKAWEEVVAKPTYAVDWLIERYRHELDLSRSVGKRQFRDTVLRVVKTLRDADEQEHYVQAVARIIDVSRDALRDVELGEGEQRLRQIQRKAPAAPIPKQDTKTILAQQHLMALLLLQPRLRDVLTTLKPEFIPDPSAREIFTFLSKNPDFDGSPTQAAALHGLGNYVKMLVLQYEELYQDLELLELRYEAERLQSHLVEQYVKTNKQKISQALQTASEAETTRLLTAAKRLDELLNKYRGGK